MLNDSKIGQLNSERPLHQTAVLHNQHIWWLIETSNIEQVGKLTDHKCHGLFVRLEQPKKLAFFMTFEKLPNNLVA